MEKVATPARACESDAGMPSKKIPKVSELTIEVGHRPPPPRRLSVNADDELYIYKYTEDASAIWEDVTEERLLVVASSIAARRLRFDYCEFV